MTTKVAGTNASSRAGNAAQTEATESLDECFSCHQKLWMSFFFDDFLHDEKEDDVKGCLTNLGKIFRAHREQDKSKGVYRFYYEGLGKTLSPEPKSREQAAKDQFNDAMDIAIHDGSEHLQGIPKDLAKAAAKEAGISIASKSQYHYKIDTDDIKSGLLDTALQAIFRYFSNAVPWLRDSGLAAGAFNAGVEARIDKAVKNFKDAIVEISNKTVITEINIAVFGGDRGASIARAFVTELIKRETQGKNGRLTVNTVNGEAVLQLRYVGLFDAVSHVIPPGSSFSDAMEWFGKIAKHAGKLVAKLTDNEAAKFLSQAFGPNIREWYDLDMPKDVQRLVHYVAGNEIRPTRCLDSVSESQCDFEEVVFPGSQYDVAGGIAKQAKGKSNELALVPLRRMLIDAYSAGVPMRSLEQLGARDPDIYLLLAPADKITYSANGKTKYGNVIVFAHTYMREMGYGSGDLSGQLKAHSKKLLSILRHQQEVQPDAISAAAYNTVKVFAQSPHLQGEPKEMVNTWNHPGSVSPEAALLYKFFMNIPLFEIEMQTPKDESSVVLYSSRVVTGIPSWQDKATEKAENVLKSIGKAMTTLSRGY
ncbi:MAG: DUF2235 domain-containing protein [Methylococcaceae bacterium]|jgi:hypothetical protein